MVFIPGIFLLTGCGETQKPYIISIAESDDNAVFGGLIVSGPTTTNSFTSAEQNIIINNSKTEDKNSNYEIISKQEIIDYCRNNWDSNIWNLNKISGLPDLY